MRFSVGLPQTVSGPDVVRFARRAEELGFVGLWTMDSPVGGPTSRNPSVDGLHALTYAAPVTDAIRLGIAVIVLPLRNPLLLARELASIDRLSGGRLTVGVGLGVAFGPLLHWLTRKPSRHSVFSRQRLVKSFTNASSTCCWRCDWSVWRIVPVASASDCWLARVTPVTVKT